MMKFLTEFVLGAILALSIGAVWFLAMLFL
jgi:hypothetical protein